MMLLGALIEAEAEHQVVGSGELSVSDVTDDSRTVIPGCLFIARRGGRDDGRVDSYIAEAVRRGAVAVVSEDPPNGDRPPVGPGGRQVAWVRVPHCDHALVGRLAERFFGYPSRGLTLIGVTGTNGKTTTAALIQHLLGHAGRRCGLIGTLCVDDSQNRSPADLTTPGPAALSRHLAAMVANGCRAAVMEVSSHAMAQGRCGALRFDVGVFTNLTGDHLDYHGDMDRYAAAKARLFRALPAEGWAVINTDDPYAQRMVQDCPAKVVACRTRGGEPRDETDLPGWGCEGTPLDPATDHSRARLVGPWGRVEVTYPLVGRHNLANLLQAVTACHTVVDVSGCLKEAVAACPVVPGRLERVGVSSGRGVTQVSRAGQTQPTVLVDYAHTHDALENVLRSLRPLTRGRLIVVFGCGGDRDRSKRPRMAAVACRWADRVVITSDNPRAEDPAAIIRDILEGVPDQVRDEPPVPGAYPGVEPDRARAIAVAIGSAKAGDTVLIAGKGHETYQIIGDQRLDFDDRVEAAKALKAWRRGQGVGVAVDQEQGCEHVRGQGGG